MVMRAVIGLALRNRKQIINPMIKVTLPWLHLRRLSSVLGYLVQTPALVSIL